MQRMAEIRVTKSVLLIPEQVLWRHIPSDELKKGIERGKAYRRCERVSRHEKSMEDYRKEDVHGKKVME